METLTMQPKRESIFLLWIILLLSLNSISGEVLGQDATTEEALLPRMDDWFLSTGDWQNDPQIYVREYGSGDQVVVLLHGGWGGDHKGMMSLVEGMEEVGRFILYDQRGSLRSPFPDSLITFDQHIEDVERLRKAIKVDQLTLVGHSMGSILASAYASRYPEKIASLILMSPPGFLKNPLPEEDWKPAEEKEDEKTAFMKRAAIKEEIVKYQLDRSSPPLTSQEETSLFRINFAGRMLYDVTKWTELRGGRALYKGKVFGLTQTTYPKEGWNFIEDIRKASYPITLIIGDHDFLDFGAVLAKRWAAEIPRMELLVVEKAGHSLWIDQPEKMKHLLEKTLQKRINDK
ncbi:MAG: alpha/beta hydrolase [Bacteroidota bacterium]